MSYGINFYGENGDLELSLPDSVVGEIFSEEYDYDHSGTENVPAFDDNRGAVNVTMHIDTTSATTISGRSPRAYLGINKVPSLNWNNSSKTLTLSPSATPDSVILGDFDYHVRLLHYK